MVGSCSQQTKVVWLLNLGLALLGRGGGVVYAALAGAGWDCLGCGGAWVGVEVSLVWSGLLQPIGLGGFSSPDCKVTLVGWCCTGVGRTSGVQ